MKITTILLYVFLMLVVYYIWRHFMKKKLVPRELTYIPKKIFQLVPDKNNINPAFRKNIEYIQKLNPGWEYILYDDSEGLAYIRRHYGEQMVKYYYMLNDRYGAARADFLRYLIMYREGGVYLDIKSAMLYPLDNIIEPDDEYILSHWLTRDQASIIGNDKGEYQQWHIICKPHHPYLKAVIDFVIQNIQTYNINEGIGKPGVLKVTGPIAYTQAILPIVNEHKHRIFDCELFAGLIYNNIGKSHVNLFSSTHYSKVKEPIVIQYRY